MKKYTGILIVSFFLAFCQKEIDLDLNSSGPQLVIEGNISDEPGPYTIKLSKTVNFNQTNNYPPVTGATVIISDHTGTTDSLTETIPGSYQTLKIKGTPGQTYTLKVVAENKQYNAVSTMPYKVNLDSLQFDPFTNPGSSGDAFAIVPIYLDPIEVKNNYRFFFSSNGIPDNSYQVSNDDIGNGSINRQPFWSDEVEFLTGDTVTVTMFCIDLSTYNYYFTLSQIVDSGPGGGATPSNPPNNITGNNALGIFSAYTRQVIKQVVR